MISIIILFVCLIVNITVSSKQFAVIEQHAQVDEYILCRHCGNDIAVSNHIVSKISPNSQYTFNDTLFHKDDVTVQMLSSDFYINFPIITISQSTCLPTEEEWKEIDSWFPGYSWNLCVCPECGAFIGWVFKPINPSIAKTSDPLYGLILESVVGSAFTDSLIKYPIILEN
ncbi:protein cereblon isoform 1-T1 [Aphomia sociella]